MISRHNHHIFQRLQETTENCEEEKETPHFVIPNSNPISANLTKSLQPPKHNYHTLSYTLKPTSREHNVYQMEIRGIWMCVELCLGNQSLRILLEARWSGLDGSCEEGAVNSSPANGGMEFRC